MVSIRASAVETFVKWWDARAGMLTVSFAWAVICSPRR